MKEEASLGSLRTYWHIDLRHAAAKSVLDSIILTWVLSRVWVSQNHVDLQRALPSVISLFCSLPFLCPRPLILLISSSFPSVRSSCLSPSCPITNPYYASHINCGSGTRLPATQANKNRLREEIGVGFLSCNSPSGTKDAPQTLFPSLIWDFFHYILLSSPTQHNNSWKVDNY